MNKVKGPKQYTPEWYYVRFLDDEDPAGTAKCGASEAGVFMQHPYRTTLDLYREKLRIEPPWEPAPGDLRARLGSAMEPIILDFAEELLPMVFPELEGAGVNEGRLRIRRNIPMYWLEDHPATAASCDGLIMHNQSAVDAKATFSPSRMTQFGEEGTDQLPSEVIMQGQQQALVMDCQYVYFPVFLGVGVVKCYRVERNPDLCELILDGETELHERIVNRDPPEPDWEHPRVLALARRLHGLTTGVVVELGPAAVRAWHEYETFAQMERSMEQLKESAQAKLYYQMGEAEIGRLPGGEQEVVRYSYDEKLWTQEEIEALKAGARKRVAFQKMGVRKIKERK